MRNTVRASFVALALLAAPCVVFAQAQGRGGPPQEYPPGQPEPDFGRYLFPPELIMQHQQTINLRPDQRTAITQAIQQMQSKVIELQWQMQSEVQKLTELMQASTIKEAEALAQVDRVLGIERDVKRTHLGTLIRIKNALSRDQQTALDSLKQMWEQKALRSSNEIGPQSGTKKPAPPDGDVPHIDPR